MPVAVAAAAALTCGGGARGAEPRSAVAATVLAVVQPRGNGPTALARLDARSLRQEGPSVDVPEYHSTWTVSPDGSQVALGRGSEGIGVEIVDVRELRLVRSVHTGIAAEALAWLAPRKLVASLQRGGTVVVDPATGRVTRRWLGYSFPDAAVETKSKLVALVPRFRPGPPNLPLVRVGGPPRLVTVDSAGRLRTVTLRRIRLGDNSNGGVEYVDRAGLAVDEARGRALVVAAGSPVAVVDLATMRPSYHTLAPLPPTGSDRALARWRSARPFGTRSVVVFGRDIVAGGAVGQSVPAGAILVDTVTWRWRVLEPDASGAAVSAGRLLVFGRRGDGATRTGIRIYRTGGRTPASVLAGKRILDVFATPSVAYVRTSEATYAVDPVRARSRKIDDAPSLVDVIAPGS